MKDTTDGIRLPRDGSDRYVVLCWLHSILVDVTSGQYPLTLLAAGK